MKRVLCFLLMGVRRSGKLSQLIGAKRLKSSISTARPVCVGVDGDMKRFMVHTKLLLHEKFLQLLYRSAEE